MNDAALNDATSEKSARAARWGVATGYHDASGAWRDVPDTTIDAVLEAMGADGESPVVDDDVWCIGVGDPPPRLDAPARLFTEDGGELDVVDALPPDLPVGYHRLARRDAEHVTRLIVSPRACFLPDRLHTWGWAVQLYGLRSRESWGIGDLDDLRRLALVARPRGGHGAGEPAARPSPGVPQQPSPYYPSSRRFRNLLHLRVDDEQLNDTQLRESARAMNADRHIDRDAIFRLKLQALERQWERFSGDAAFDRYVTEQGESLVGYATFCAQRELGHADPDRVRFHMWVQWLLDRQLEVASRELPLVHDLAVGVDPDGADAWVDRDAYANGVSVGAPPDEFNTGGQDWGLLPFDPWRLRATGYEPFIETVRAGFRHAGGLRVDHVMGLFRLFWVPAGCGPDEGTYVQYPAADLLDILAVESHRAQAFVVGEDLGTVEDGVRADLARRRVLSYRLLYFEPGDPSRAPGERAGGGDDARPPDDRRACGRATTSSASGRPACGPTRRARHTCAPASGRSRGWTTTRRSTTWWRAPTARSPVRRRRCWRRRSTTRWPWRSGPTSPAPRKPPTGRRHCRSRSTRSSRTRVRAVAEALRR